jgi:hypothetical protein
MLEGGIVGRVKEVINKKWIKPINS